jgi:hypothetical protein
MHFPSLISDNNSLKHNVTVTMHFSLGFLLQRRTFPHPVFGNKPSNNAYMGKTEEVINN